MSRYIDADAVKKEYIQRIWYDADGYLMNEKDKKLLADLFVDAVPTADVAEVKHGRWEVAGDMSYVKCSHCGGLFVCYYNYCPNCGAKMDEVDNENPEP